MKAGMQTGRRKHLLRGTGLALVLSMLTGLVMPMGGLTGAADVVIEEPVILEAAEPEEAVILVEQEMPDGDGVVEVIPEDPAEAEDEPAPEAPETEDVPEEEIPDDPSADPSADTQDGDSVIEITDEETDEGSAELEEDTGDSVIPVEPETEAGEQTPESQPETVLQADAGGMTVTVAGKLPENVVLTAAMVQEETEMFMPGETLFSDGYGTVIVEEAAAEEDAPVFSVDITLFDENGEVWQPEEAVTVTLDAAALGLRDGDEIQILHEHEGMEYDLGVYVVEDGLLVFEMDKFSVVRGFMMEVSEAEGMTGEHWVIMK